ncbi:MAG TPA: GlcNAc-transferase family protein, partial [Reyranellaceae bacterium]|nr:GlcNAc-transferase family protein [Reyranellaceae bacterium]
FAPAAIIEEVPYDPYIYFTGEEITLAARLWTHGWDLFTPNRCTVYHEYSERPNKRRHWHDHKLWNELSERAAARVRHIMGTEVSGDAEALRDVEKYSLGGKRTREAYEAFSGVDFRRKLIGGKTQEELESMLAPQERSKRIAARFSEIWRSNGWNCAETRSGSGATLAQTEVLRGELTRLFGELGIRTLVDAGCGELNWMSRISDALDLYLGFDVVEDLIAQLRERFERRKSHFFNTAEITRDVLPRADAVLCRDVLTHLPHAMVREALTNFRASGARYLIATTFPRGRNEPIRIGAWQAMDLCAEPFGLPRPKLLISEQLKNSVKSLGVWALRDLS